MKEKSTRFLRRLSSEGVDTQAVTMLVSLFREMGPMKRWRSKARTKKGVAAQLCRGCLVTCCCCMCCRRGQEHWNRRRMGSGDLEVTSRDIEGVLNANAIPPPEHLVILVNGIIGSPSDWTFAAKQFSKRLGRHVAIHCSESSAALQTFDGVDVMGKRLAEEVREIIDRTPGVKRISFVAHSLGGLVTRYAISELYCPPVCPPVQEVNESGVMDPSFKSTMTTPALESEFTIGGLKPENFITLATPHLGCRGNQQLPFLLGVQVLEKTATYMAHWFVGQTGKHLFLTDGYESHLPLLRQMVTDCKEGQFLSSLRAFKTRTAYANVVNDQVVGWRTSSIRRKSEMPEISHKPVNPKYPHIVREEEPVTPVEDVNVVNLPPVADLDKDVEDFIEEEIVAGLTQLSWRRVDVSFRGTKGGYQAHNLIQVKNERVHYEGADVIEHILDKHFVNAEMTTEWCAHSRHP